MRKLGRRSVCAAWVLDLVALLLVDRRAQMVLRPGQPAADGVFLRPFAHLSEEHRFPDVALVVMGVLALPACLFPLEDVINALTTGIVLIQSIAQIAALGVVRARGIRAPYRMWLFPLPAIIALVGWVYVFASAGAGPILFGIMSLLAGTVVFGIRAFRQAEWPFESGTTGARGRPR